MTPQETTQERFNRLKLMSQGDKDQWNDYCQQTTQFYLQDVGELLDIIQRGYVKL